MIAVLMPIAPTHSPPLTVIQSIDIPHQLEIMESETEKQNPVKWSRIANARNTLLRMVETDRFLWLDSDILLPPGVLEQVFKWMNSYPEYGAVGIPVNRPAEFQTHIRISAMMVKRESCEGITIRYEGNRCDCRCFVNDLTNRGHPVYHWRGDVAKEIERETC